MVRAESIPIAIGTSAQQPYNLKCLKVGRRFGRRLRMTEFFFAALFVCQ